MAQVLLKKVKTLMRPSEQECNKNSISRSCGTGALRGGWWTLLGKSDDLKINLSNIHDKETAKHSLCITATLSLTFGN